MGQTCGKCSRVNPPDAAYCYYDGFVLNGHVSASGPVNAGAQLFASSFVFPTGQACRNFDQLAMACQQNWSAALEVLQQGYLEGFLGNLGRVDLAQSAREAARFPDRDRGLDQFLAALPSEVLKPPKLLVEPRDVNLGVLRIGEDRRLELHLANQGMRLLYGSVVCENCLWLSLGDAPGSQQKMFQFDSELVMPLNVRGKHLRAGRKPLEGRLVFDSNGGTVAVIVRAEVPVKPFPDGVLAGATSPRQVAEKAKASPKEAAVLFENGAVARWYKDNGWTYPVQGPSASGLGAVQQFFEALGLTKPPKLKISDRSVNFVGEAGRALQYNITVRSDEKRPVYAYAHSNQDWLKTGKPQLGGNVVTIPLKIPQVPYRQGDTLMAKVSITSNGNQQFVVPVALAIAGGEAIPIAASATPEAPILLTPVHAEQPIQLTPIGGAPAPPSAVQPAREVNAMPAPRGNRPVAVPVPPPGRSAPAPTAAAPTGPSGGKLPEWVHLLPAGILALVLLMIILHDLLLGPGVSGDDGPIDPRPRLILEFQDRPNEHFSDATMRFGLTLAPDPSRPSQFKKLTYSATGDSNNTVLRVDNAERIFGERPGAWISQKVDLGRDSTGRQRVGARSIWNLDNAGRIIVTQTVEIVPGEQTQLLDTCLVRYRIENKDSQSHTVGLRFMLDCFIGGNDGVPYTVPGQPGLIDSKLDMPTQGQIPDFLQALETENLANPGTVAHVKLRMASPLDPPERVTIGAWPNYYLKNVPIAAGDAVPAQQKTGWNVPVLDMRAMMTMTAPANRGPADSCVVIYWFDRPLNPGQSREMGFSYGVGTVSGGEGSGRLGLTASGSFVPGGTFTVTAYVNGPQPGESLTLQVPEGFRIESGGATQSVPAASGGSQRSPVTWKVRAGDRKGRFTLRVQSSAGAGQSTPVIIKPSTGIFD